ncbi:hypothetical protein ZHAS_00010297 [Anopheles sinensis]|uniref:Uncharacterized protein n=1 Tax=Anopheles sinensis TaxID=74873 RepID=A0A084VX87_ANOSI|nr:hypothetical protein ZHAS_00010297 [Anopheles sinensis]
MLRCEKFAALSKSLLLETCASKRVVELRSDQLFSSTALFGADSAESTKRVERKHIDKLFTTGRACSRKNLFSCKWSEAKASSAPSSPPQQRSIPGTSPSDPVQKR